MGKWIKDVKSIHDSKSSKFMFYYILKIKENFRQKKLEEGFTLLEMNISIGIFATLVVIAIGITLGIAQAQFKAANIQTVQDNARFTLEFMTKEIRTGTRFSGSSICQAGSENSLHFFTATGGERFYFWDALRNRIMRSIQDPGGSGQCDITQDPPRLPADGRVKQFTSEDVKVEQFGFVLFGEQAGPDDGQPRITISLRMSAITPRAGTDTVVRLQTTVVPRFREL